MTSPFFLFVLMVLSVVGVVNSYKIFQVKKYIQKNLILGAETLQDNEALPNFILLLPLLRETKYAQNLLGQVINTDYPKDKLSVVVVTSIREFEIPNNGENTVTLVTNTIEKLNEFLESKLFFHYHYTDPEGIKSDQLNFGIKEFIKENPSVDKSKTYIGIYDADSTIHKDIFKKIGTHAVRFNFPPAYQQPTYYFANYRHVSDLAFENACARAFGLLQTSYAFYVENFNYINRYPLLGPFPKLLYLIGHGMFIKFATLERVGFFPSPIEDTRLGHILSFLNIPIRLIFIPDNIDIATSIQNRIKQSSVWFLGVTYFRKDLNIASAINLVGFFKKNWFYTYRIYRNIVWASRGLLLLILISFGLYFKLRLLTVLVLLLYLYLPTISTLYVINKISPDEMKIFSLKNLIFPFVLLPVEYLFMSIGPLYGFVKMIFMQKSSKKYLFPKTEK